MTRQNYYGIWKNFNQFLIHLDIKPTNWEDCLTLFVGHLIDTKHKSATVRSYILAIKCVFMENNIEVTEDKFLLSSLIRACVKVNDHMRAQFPIKIGMLRLILKKVRELYSDQPYLTKLYEAVFVSGYFGLLRVGKIAQGPHVIRVKDVHVGQNKNKILFILRSSKTRSKGNNPQFVKLTGYEEPRKGNKTTEKYHDRWDTGTRIICPFACIKSFISCRAKAITVNEQFFVFSDGSPLTPKSANEVLHNAIKLVGIEIRVFSFHSLRTGTVTDLLRMGCSVETIKKIGR